MPRFTEFGVSGLRQFGGTIDEERLRQLKHDQGRRVFREMSDNDAIVGAILFAIENMLRGVDWRVEPVDDSPDERDRADFVETAMDDMSHTWSDFIAEALSMLVFGWSFHETVFKRRDGPLQKDPRRRSRHSDGLIGWRKLPVRAQDTLDRWEFDESGGIQGFWQLPPDGGQPLFIPIEKGLLFKTTSRKNNPEGRSVLRNSYVSWYHKTRIQNVEAIGIERDLAGMPLIYAPLEVWGDDPESKAQLAEYQRILQNVKRDEQDGIMFPSIFDDNGNRLLEFSLVGASGSAQRQFDTTKIIQRYNQEMAMTLLADFILLGHEKVGSFSLSTDKTNLFATALGAWLKEIGDVVNRHGIPRLFQLNNFDSSETPQIVPGDIEKPDIERFTTAIANLTSVGWLTPGAEADEDHLRTLLNMPQVPTDIGAGPPPPDPEEEE